MTYSMNPYFITAKGAGDAELFIYGDIGGFVEESVHAANLVKQLSELKASRITVRINSWGGAVSDALAIYNALRKHKATVHSIVDGVAVSAASLIPMGSDTISMHEASLMMIHGPRGMVVVGTANEMRELADVLDKFAAAMAPAYAARSGKPEADIMRMLTSGEDHWFLPEEAKAEGFADTVIPAKQEAPESNWGRMDWMQAYSVPARISAIMRTIRDPDRRDEMPSDDQKKIILSKKETAYPAQSAESEGQHETVLTSSHVIEPVAGNIEPAQAAVDIESVTAAERSRGMLIREHCDSLGLEASMADALIRDDVPLVEARRRILDAVAARTDEVQIRSQAALHSVEDALDKYVRGATDWIIQKSGLSGLIARADGRKVEPGEFRGMTMLELARHSLEMAGVNTRGMDKLKVVEQAFMPQAAYQTTSGFPVLLENTLNKVLMASWAVTPDTWSRWCATGSVSDFRPHNRYITGSFGSLDSLTEHGEFRNKQIPDGIKELITASTKGNIIGISRHAIINDDLGAFNSLAVMFGRAGKLSIEVDAYSVLVSNGGLGPVLASDSKTLFHADHNNISTSAGAPSIATFEADRVLMATQTDISGNEILDLAPAIWLGPKSLGGQARVTNDDQYDPDSTNALQRSNMVRGLYRDIVDTARLPATVWYSFADPSVMPVIEVAFLDGMQEPFLESQQGWRFDGVEWKVRLDYGVAGVGFRGAVKNAGA